MLVPSMAKGGAETSPETRGIAQRAVQNPAAQSGSHLRERLKICRDLHHSLDILFRRPGNEILETNIR